MDADISHFSDEERWISDLISRAVVKYSRNPRDIKRFINSFRFYYFLRSARSSRGEAVPSLEQMSRWILLSLRWPEIVRWLRSCDASARTALSAQFGQLEMIADKDLPLDAWALRAAAQMGLRGTPPEWLADEDLLQFLSAERGRPESERLSASVGKGLW